MSTATKKKSKAKAKTKTMSEAKVEVAENNAKAVASTTKARVAKAASKAAEATIDKKGVSAGERYLVLVNGDNLEIPKFNDGAESQDAKCGYLIGCHIVSRAKDLKLDRVLLTDEEGNPIKDGKTKLSVWAYDYGHIYDVILKQTSTDLKPYHKANKLTSGVYRTSMPPTSMNNKDKTKNTYAKGGLFFIRSKSVGLRKDGTGRGNIFSIPKYDRAGHYKKNAPDIATLKAACERIVSRVTA